MMKPDGWERLRAYTSARIALGRAGASLPTRELLDFRMAHAQAKDAVHAEFNAAGIAREIAESCGVPTRVLHSAAQSREEYLLRPDLGRMLDDRSREVLTAHEQSSPDLVIIVSDGLSATAAQRQVLPVLRALLPRLEDWSLATVCVVAGGRVALQDEIGGLLGAKLSLMLLGERPGLGSPDSLGAYFTWSPRPGRSDAERNCVSNIRPEGLSPEAAALKLAILLESAHRLGVSGIALKDESGPAALPAVEDQRVE